MLEIILISEGIDASRIIKTGSCMKEILDYYNSDINKSKVLDRFKT
jgi:UDP-N-acetylglucosamine 2-epimerase (non-hydrolysing)